jgi:DNA-binding transcriptional LysR family regulator
MNLRGLDLNLLPVFEAVYAQGSITRAAEQLHLTQPAVSNALTRLREALGDPLFVRVRAGVAPTPAAQALIGSVRDALTRLRAGLGRQAGFDPATSDRLFNIASRDVSASAIIPRLARVLDKSAASVRFTWAAMDRADVAAEFAAGRIDFAIDIPALARPEYDSAQLSSDPYVCVLRKGHPRAKGKFGLREFMSLRHLTVSSRRTGKGVVDVALSRIGERIRPVLRLPYFQPAVHAVMESDLALCAPLSLARRYDVAIRDLPFRADTIDLLLFWRRDAAGDAGMVWARDLLIASAKSEVARNEGGRPSGEGAAAGDRR